MTRHCHFFILIHQLLIPNVSARVVCFSDIMVVVPNSLAVWKMWHIIISHATSRLFKLWQFKVWILIIWIHITINKPIISFYLFLIVILFRHRISTMFGCCVIRVHEYKQIFLRSLLDGTRGLLVYNVLFQDLNESNYK